MNDLAKVVMERIDALGKISEEPDRLTRTFCSDAMRRANNLVARWMREAGMEARVDAIGNLIGRFSGGRGDNSAGSRKTLLLGSHLDTVRDAGKFDGPLGVLIAIACIQHIKNLGMQLPFDIEVVGFCDEEGVRYQSTYLGSRALAGTFSPKDLKRVDANGTSMAEAIREFGGNPDAIATAKANKRNLLGYLEVHIEQGPVLERSDLSVGVVSAISGQSRYQYQFVGRAGHAGTVPMSMRTDALCAAAEFITAVESCARRIAGLVATVGMIHVAPAASNVIPGEASLSLDVRHADDRIRNSACRKLQVLAAQIARRRGLRMKANCVHQADSVLCDKQAADLLGAISKRHQRKSLVLPSGAGHDAAAMAAITPVAMLFVRCKGGISHNPAESVAAKDVAVALRVLIDFVLDIAQQRTPPPAQPEGLPDISRGSSLRDPRFKVRGNVAPRRGARNTPHRSGKI